jgi:hypothetical protein
MASKSDEPDGTARIHRKRIGFDVETNCRWFADMAALQTTLLRLLAGWLSRTPWLEVKCTLARHLAEDAEGVEQLRRRLPGLRAGDDEVAACTRRAAEVVLPLDDAPGAVHFLAALYGHVKPLVLAACKAHLARTDPLADAPSARCLRPVMDDLRRQVAWGRRTLKTLAARSEALAAEVAEAEEWAKALVRGIRKAGGLPGPTVPADGRRFARKPQPQPLLDDRFRVVPAGEAAPEQRPRNRVQQVWKYMHARLIGELQCVEVFARNIYEFPESPFDYHLAMARCAWDEARHTAMLAEELERLGGRLGDWVVQFSVYAAVTAGETPLERAILFHGFAENRRMDAVSDDRWFFEDMDQLVPALHRDYELADEVDHVRLGNRWARRFAQGDEDLLGSTVRSLEARGLLPIAVRDEPAVRAEPTRAAAPVDLRCKRLAECSPQQMEILLRLADGRIADGNRTLRVVPR